MIGISVDVAALSSVTVGTGTSGSAISSLSLGSDLPSVCSLAREGEGLDDVSTWIGSRIALGPLFKGENFRALRCNRLLILSRKRTISCEGPNKLILAGLLDQMGSMRAFLPPD